MLSGSIPRLTKWPFFAGTILLLGLAGLICVQQGGAPWGMAMALSAVTGGVSVWLIPFLVEYRAVSRLAEATLLSEVSGRLEGVEQLAGQLHRVSAEWRAMQAQAEQTTAGAREITDRMSTEAQAFMEFIKRANEQEKATLRLEVEKLRRAETEWLQVLVRMMDHVYALHRGAVQSGHRNVAEQVGQFQNACRDAARRVGLTPIEASRAEPFDVQKHQLADGQVVQGNARVAETVATGYTFQGKLLRPAIVRLVNGSA